MILLMACNFAVHISIASIAINLILAIVALLIGSSSSNCAFAVDCALDIFSSCILLWRFYGDSHRIDGNLFIETSFNRKELIACLGLGIMFIVSGIIVMTKSIIDLIFANLSASSIDDILHLASASFILCGLLAIGKYVLYRYMNSNSMFLESINSLISSAFALIIVITTIIIEYEEHLWRLDPIISLLFSTFMIIYGVFIVKKSIKRLNNNNSNKSKIKVEYAVIP